MKKRKKPKYKEFVINDIFHSITYNRINSKSCVFCDYCTDLFYDYTNGIYCIKCCNNKHINIPFIHYNHIFTGKCKKFKNKKEKYRI